MRKVNVAIDGPVGSGKTTIGKILATKLGYQFLDSGLLFRHFAKFWKENNLPEVNKGEAVKLSLLWQKKLLNNINEIPSRLEKEKEVLSSWEIGDLASQLATLSELRQIILHCQRQLTRDKGWVVVGRDITSEVLPQAEIKVFLTASFATRIKRRYYQYQEKISQEEVETELRSRDERDEKRAVCPLKKTADSWELDTTNLSPAESVEKIITWGEKNIN
jgi:CMP/dCMP kinase